MCVLFAVVVVVVVIYFILDYMEDVSAGPSVDHHADLLWSKKNLFKIKYDEWLWAHQKSFC